MKGFSKEESEHVSADYTHNGVSKEDCNVQIIKKNTAMNLLGDISPEQGLKIYSCPVIYKAALFAAKKMEQNEGSHSFRHVLRVHKVAVQIAEKLIKDGTCIDMRLVQLGALLHDVFDRKVYKPGPGDKSGSELLLDFLLSLGLPEEYASHVVFIADGISFSKQKKIPIPENKRSIEMDIVQDADRLDAIGAIGIARCFAYGGHTGRGLEDSRAHFDSKVSCFCPHAVACFRCYGSKSLSASAAREISVLNLF